VGILRRRTPEQRFWDWFVANSDRLFAFEEDQERIFDDLQTALQRVADGLTFEFGPVEDGRREVFISADGIAGVFPAVRRLVASAPAMPEWQVVAFRQPHGVECEVQFGDQSIGPDGLWFVARPDGAIVHLDLYVRGLTDEDREAMTAAAFILLDNALGEERMVEAVGALELEPLPEDPVDAGLTPLPQLPEVLDDALAGERPFLNPGHVDLYAVRKGGGADLVIVVAEPLSGDPGTQEALMDKVESYLGFINSEEFAAECGRPSPESVCIKISTEHPVDAAIRDLIDRMGPWAEENNASIRLDVEAG